MVSKYNFSVVFPQYPYAGPPSAAVGVSATPEAPLFVVAPTARQTGGKYQEPEEEEDYDEPDKEADIEPRGATETHLSHGLKRLERVNDCSENAIPDIRNNHCYAN